MQDFCREGQDMTLERITESNLNYAVQIQEELFPGESARTNYNFILITAYAVQHMAHPCVGKCALHCAFQRMTLQ